MQKTDKVPADPRPRSLSASLISRSPHPAPAQVAAGPWSDPNEKLLSAAEVADLLGYKQKTIYKWLEEGLIPTEAVLKNGRRVRFWRNKLLASWSSRPLSMRPKKQIKVTIHQERGKARAMWRFSQKKYSQSFDTKEEAEKFKTDFQHAWERGQLVPEIFSKEDTRKAYEEHLKKALGAAPATAHYIDQLQVESSRSESANHHADHRRTFAEAFEWFMENYSALQDTPASQMQNRSLYNVHLKEPLGDLPLASITSRQLKEFQTSLTQKPKSSGGKASDEPISAKTVRNIFAVVRSVFREAYVANFVYRNPTVGIKDPRYRKKQSRIWTEEERDRFFECCIKLDPDLHDIIGLYAYTGMRLGELAALTPEQVFEDRIHVCQKKCFKTNEIQDFLKCKLEPRDAPMNWKIREFIRGREKGPKDVPMFSYDFRHLSSRHFRKMQLKAGVPVITVHGLRHTFGTMMCDKNPHYHVVGSMMGHASIKTTMGYVRVLGKQWKEAADALLPNDQPVSGD
ncbi:MAG TPA: tyrosine-type recombinase/integrase [Oligoflexus sp.]|uniref:tyrosine-type recombinase/integrase n=1 Tax=Oligoflexus sp. TaxID=1971216 RepID=UPI002D7FD6B4|nr:tyrosine-type recombinase/integrase [Oligoflexus sp.]HET9240519.1 tyrosine-type recombinase/integrase [Oligoflexus sp.]